MVVGAAADAGRIEGLLRWELLQDAAVLARCRRELSTAGILVVKDFATADGLRRLRSEVRAAPCNEAANRFTAYQDQGDAHYPADHPRNHRFESTVGFVGRQTLERTPERLGVAIYQDPRERLLTFLSGVVERQLHRSVDENGSVYSYLAMPGHDPPWHFDESHWTAIVYLQNGAAGGAFEFVPLSRPSQSKDDERGHEIVREVLMDGDLSRVHRIAAEPGSLVFFAGCHALHRAAPVLDSTARIGLVFTFGESDGFANSDETKANNEWSVDDAGRSKL